MREITVEQWAIDFFAEFFLGEHHIPGYGKGIKKFGTGYCINYHPGNLATFDFDGMTRLVFLSHRDCIRSEICHQMLLVPLTNTIAILEIIMTYSFLREIILMSCLHGNTSE